MGIRPEVIPFVLCAVLAGVVLAVLYGLIRGKWRRASLLGLLVGIVFSGYFLFFFRDPDRTVQAEQASIVAAADGSIANIVKLTEAEFFDIARKSGLTPPLVEKLAAFRGGGVLRISIFLSLFDVHVNRAPISGEAEFLGYFPGRHFFTFQEKSSEENQHNAILLENEDTACLLYQIVGPVCRRVVYWPDHDRRVLLRKGARIGMMKFGSRLDMYFPEADIGLRVRVGDVVRAGETVIATLNKKESL